ncbi:MAG: choice-of-anchor tandem repeat GloVer-containing protein [Candidatus Cybelea sp.]
MKRISRVCCALSVCATAAVVAGCSGSAQLPSPMAQTPFGNTSTVDRVASSSGTAKDAERSRYTKTILYSFRSGNDGIGPSGRLLDEGGTFYGETAGGGGSSGCYNPGPGCGTIFKLTPSGKKYAETILYRFGGPNGNDGQVPSGGVVYKNRALFGTTSFGGNYNRYACYDIGCGTVFKLPLSGSGSEQILFAFSGTNGALVSRGVIDKGGTLFGTTNYEGEYGYGTVFDLTPSGAGYTENTLHEFADGSDGGLPPSGVIDVDGSLYGVTGVGGAHNYGTVYRLTPSASGYTETILYSFTGGSDGKNTGAGVIDVKGSLYGTTGGGGAHNFGTVFKLTPSGSGYVESTLYSFKGGRDAAGTYSTLTEQGGTIYGTSEHGGLVNYGTVFKLTPSGSGYTESVIYRFKGGTDGADPYWGVVADKNGTLYSTTATGGPFGNGTVFALTPH